MPIAVLYLAPYLLVVYNLIDIYFILIKLSLFCCNYIGTHKKYSEKLSLNTGA
jgi:hypothetical protein